jgi:hypothetical protein
MAGNGPFSMPLLTPENVWFHAATAALEPLPKIAFRSFSPQTSRDGRAIFLDGDFE